MQLANIGAASTNTTQRMGIRFQTLSPLLCIAIAAACGCTTGPDDTERPEERESLPTSVIEPSVGEQSMVQTESKYVTDPSRWGRLIFNPGEIRPGKATVADTRELAVVIKQYLRSWLDLDAKNLSHLLDRDITSIRRGRVAHGIDEVTERQLQGYGERPYGRLALELTVRDVDLRVHGDTATALYKVDAYGGARWEFADMVVIFQAFRRHEDQWLLAHHAETWTMGDDDAPSTPSSVPNRITPFHFEYVYPVKDLQRALAFYIPLLGEPETVTANRASFKLRDTRFHLDAERPDDRLTIEAGRPNGYGIIDVTDLGVTSRRLADAGALAIKAPQPCGPDMCLVAEDPSGNLIVWREVRPTRTSKPVKPKVSMQGNEQTSERVATALRETMVAWMSTDRESLARRLTEDARWIDDALAGNPLSFAVGREQIAGALEARWRMLDRGDDGLDAEIAIDELRSRVFGEGVIASYETTLRGRGSHPFVHRALVSQVWIPVNGDLQIEFSFIIASRKAISAFANSMDYTAYVVTNLVEARDFYSTVLGVEPYRDVNWFGYWSTTSVFGMFRPLSKEAGIPVAHRANGYADFSVSSISKVYEYLKERGAKFPVIPGFNDTAGIDQNPGYKQILTVDTEGNLVNFSEYSGD